MYFIFWTSSSKEQILIPSHMHLLFKLPRNISILHGSKAKYRYTMSIVLAVANVKILVSCLHVCTVYTLAYHICSRLSQYIASSRFVNSVSQQHAAKNDIFDVMRCDMISNALYAVWRIRHCRPLYWSNFDSNFQHTPQNLINYASISSAEAKNEPFLK